MAAFQGEDLEFVPDGGIEVRGASSRLTQQKSYKFEFEKKLDAFENANGAFASDRYGMRCAQFNGHPYGLSRIRNKLSLDGSRKIDDFSSPRTQFVAVSV